MEPFPYLKLSELTGRIRQVMADAFGNQSFWVIAEISGHKFYPDKDRHYFDLVEKIESSSTETAKVKANSWEQGSRQIALFEQLTGQKFQDGLQVLVCVRINYHIIHGLAFTVVDIDPNFTIGNVERQRRETLRRLASENGDAIREVDGQYLTRNKNARLPGVIQRIALIGSPRSEGYTDFVHTLDTNQYGYRYAVDVYYSSVQGVNAEHELVSTLIQVYERSKATPYDCVIIIRGGGARTDFLPFDTYPLARAVARFPIPVITGIGHHKDVSLVDLMAHTPTKTPTKAAEFLLAHNRGFEEKILQFRQRLIVRTQVLLGERNRSIGQCYARLSRAVPGLLHRHERALSTIIRTVADKPRHLFSGSRREVTRLQQVIITASTDQLYTNERRLSATCNRVISGPRELMLLRKRDLAAAAANVPAVIARFVAGQDRYLTHLQALIRLMSPRNLLRKGFAIVSRGEQVITDPAQIGPGERITVTLADADIQTIVESKSKADGKYDL